MIRRRPWQEELEIIDRTMRAISGIVDPQELVDVYWDGIGQLIHVGDYVAVSRRGVEPPYYLLTRSSRFEREFNPWTERDKLPLLKGGILGEIAYAERPVLIEDLDKRLREDDPAYFHLRGFGTLAALPQYDSGQALNVSAMLFPPGEQIDYEMFPMLHWQGGLFGRGTQNLVLRNELAATLRRLDAELQAVGEIQRSLLPESLPHIPGFELAADYQTSARAGGDYYDFFPLPNGQWGILVADVSGHGTPAAVLMAITHAIAHTQPGTHTPPSQMLQHLNHHLVQTYTRWGTFVTAFYAVLDPATRTLTYSRAGHNPPRLLRDGQVRSLDAVGTLPMGITQENEYEQAVVTLDPGDLLVLYTDGITEAMRPGRSGKDLFETSRLDATLLACGGASPAECVRRVREAVDAFTGNSPATDDRTMIAIRCTPVGS